MRAPMRVPWWLVPNLLALDAPLVAVVWQRFLADQFAVFVPALATLALAAVVWAIYLADRWLDARRGCLAAERHWLAARHSRAFVLGIILALITAGLAVTQLPLAYIRSGVMISLGVGGYLALVHGLAGGLALLPGAKELLVAFGFAAGVALPLSVSDTPFERWLPSVAAFGSLCFLNCRFIELWESRSAKRPWPELLLSGVVLVSTIGLPRITGLMIATATLGLLAVHCFGRERLRLARVLADAVLLTPLACWGCL